MSALQLPELVPSWVRSLRARNLSERTIEAYTLAADQLVAHLETHGQSVQADRVSADDVREYLADVLETRASATANQRYRSLTQLFRWLEREGEIRQSPMRRIDPPRVEEQPVAVLSDIELRALLATATSKDFVDRRDLAILRLFVDSGIRLGEMAGLRVADVDLDLQVAVV